MQLGQALGFKATRRRRKDMGFASTASKTRAADLGRYRFGCAVHSIAQAGGPFCAQLPAGRLKAGARCIRGTQGR